MAVCRIGQLCGDGDNGVWNRSEAWPLMLGAGGVLGALPRLGDERLGWLAVDEAARAVLEVAGLGVGEGGTVGTGGGADTDTARPSNTHGIGAGTPQDGEEVPIYHILNPDNTRTWDDLLSWACELHPALEILNPEEWIAGLEDPDGKAGGHPARKLVGLWRGAYCGGQGKGEGGEGEAAHGADRAGKRAGKKGEKEGGTKGERKAAISFEIENARKVSETMRAVKPISEEAFGRMWAWIGANVGAEAGGGGGEGREAKVKDESKGEVEYLEGEEAEG